ncbi:hypothetical protein GOP47_0003122 [Adiantum capillus-veneris]|uniref:Uncharacterized protein n=1 Tax=Adiantum capillus-veneris TaxID=13818 RepID=A0A9D4ZPT1_ADICA|nr:hypothetical protein GOP47_0003122 [Adiantum capillus-veneris]
MKVYPAVAQSLDETYSLKERLYFPQAFRSIDASFIQSTKRCYKGEVQGPSLMLSGPSRRNGHKHKSTISRYELEQYL